MNQCEVMDGTCGWYRYQDMKEGGPCEGGVGKQRGETICHAQQRRDAGKESPMVFIGISIFRDGGKMKGVPSEERR
jgi:hypothetical protein